MPALWARNHVQSLGVCTESSLYIQGVLPLSLSSVCVSKAVSCQGAILGESLPCSQSPRPQFPREPWRKVNAWQLHEDRESLVGVVGLVC